MSQTEEEKTFLSCIGGKITLLRTKEKMTKKALADYLGVSPKQVQKYENGSREISVFNLTRISSLFHVSFSYFISEDEYEEDYDAVVKSFILRINQIDLTKAQLF